MRIPHSKPTITIIDYGASNLISVARAFEHLGIQTQLSDSPYDITQATHLVLPGVGAFGKAMEALIKKKLVDPIREYCLKKRPFIGICLGMQIMLEFSMEFGDHKGLGLIAGKVVPIPKTGKDGKPHKIPNVGWRSLVQYSANRVWDNTILHDITLKSSVYFAHSFRIIAEKESDRLADSFYDGIDICSVIKSGNLYGCQFHPEKSGPVGLKILRNFCCLE
jgi:glutamine amidotransferase|tara:strand:- start:403 stop:1065 length:663 start_codon:yes stop_codon:yes gene_type:complete